MTVGRSRSFGAGGRWPVRLLAAVTAVALGTALAACGGDDDGGGDAAAGGDDATTTTAAPPPEPSLWVTTSRGIVRVPADGGRPDEPIAYPGGSGGAHLAARDGDVWALVGASLWRVDAVAGELSDEVPIEGTAPTDPGGLALDGETAWVAQGEAGLLKVDLGSGRGEAVDIGGEAEEVAVHADGGVWVVRIPEGGRDLVELDPATGAVRRTVAVGVDFLDGAADGRLWFGSSFIGGADGYVDVASGQPKVFDRSQVYGVAKGSEAVWYALSAVVVRIDDSGPDPRIAGNIQVPQLGGYPMCCGPVVAADGSGGVWFLLRPSAGIGVAADEVVLVDEAGTSAGEPVPLGEGASATGITFG
jgi:hypothetical protein